MYKLNEICTCEAKANSKDEFVGIRCEKNAEGKLETHIFFPLDYFADDKTLSETPEEELRECIANLFSVLSDESLQDPHQDSRFSSAPAEPEEAQFPMTAYLNVIRHYLDFGYMTEKEFFHKKGAHGKVNWNRTIKETNPIVTDENNLVYLDLISRKINYNEDTLITLVHKFCVHDAFCRLGFLFGIEPTEKPLLDFDYDLFCSVIHSKLAKTFNDRDLRLLSDLARIIEFLAQKQTHDGETAKDFYFGINKFASVWEAMVNKIFGTVSLEDKRNYYNPHCMWVDETTNKPEKYEEDAEGDPNEKKRSTLRPDTIMINESGVFILDSKYYKFGHTQNKQHLPGADSVCKQMAYAEYIINKKEAEPFSDDTYNAFIMPYCAKANRWKGPDEGAEMHHMRRVGHILGDWKNGQQNYHKIVCILLDTQSVMRNYSASIRAQKKLANLITSGTAKAC